MPTPPKASKNPRYYSTGAKLDIRKSEDLYRKNHGMKKEECISMWKQQKAIRNAVKPTDDDLAILDTLLAETNNKVVAQTNEWYLNHGCITVSQLAYLRKLIASL